MLTRVTGQPDLWSKPRPESSFKIMIINTFIFTLTRIKLD